MKPPTYSSNYRYTLIVFILLTTSIMSQSFPKYFVRISVHLVFKRHRLRIHVQKEQFVTNFHDTPYLLFFHRVQIFWFDI